MSFLDDLKAFEGRTVGSLVGPDPVNEPMIRHWCEAMGDTNPVYTDAAAAAASVHGGIIAPPTMLQTWGMWGFRPKAATPNEQDKLLALLNEAGFTSVVATNCDQEYVRDLRPGDQLTVTSTIEAVSDEKQTGLGAGHFVTTKQTYTDGSGAVVATMLFRILKFRPSARTPQKPPRPRPSITRDNGWWFEALRRHQLLIQHCTSCGALRHPPRPMCDKCQSLEWDTVTASGRGSVYSFVVNHYPQVPAFDYPLPVLLVELEEGTRLIANTFGSFDVKIGMPVEVEFVDHDPELTLPAFGPV